MKNSDSEKLKELIIKAIEDLEITREEYDLILHAATEDGIIDDQEKALLTQLNDMIENKMIKFVSK